MWTRILFDRDAFAAFANSSPRWLLVFLIVAFTLLAVVSMFAHVVMGPRLVREGHLLLLGSKADGVVREATVETAGKFKGGKPKYRLQLAYAFQAPDGTRYEGQTVRTDLSERPALGPGDRMTVYYHPSDPHRSVADYNLVIDVVALALFLPFLAVLGFGVPLLFFVRWLYWRAGRAA